MSVLPFILNRGTNNDLSAYSTTAAQSLLTEARALLGTALRAVRSFLYFDGITASARRYVALGANGDGIGAPGSRWTVSRWIQVPTVAATRAIWCFSSTSTASSFVGNAMKCYLHSTDVLRLEISDTSVANRRYIGSTGSGIVAQYAGQWVLVTVTHDGTAAQPLVYINGVQRTMSADIPVGSGPAWNAGFNDDYFTDGTFDGGTLWLGGQVPSAPINAVLTPTEILTQAQTGQLPAWCELGAGSVAPTIGLSTLNGGFETAGAGGADAFANWTENVTGSSTVNRDTSVFSAGAASCRFDVDGSGSLCNVEMAAAVRPGVRYRLRCKTRTNKPGGIAKFQYSGGAAADTVADIPAVAANTWGDVDITFDATGTFFRIARVSAAALAGYSQWIDEVELVPVGPLFEHDLDPNLGLRDRKANGLHGVRTAGTAYVGEKADSTPAFKVSHSGSGPLQFAGGAAIDTTKGWVIDTLIVRSSAAVTWSLGNASGGAQYVSGYSLAVGDNYIPNGSLVTRILSGANLWSNSSGAADITIIPVLRRTY